MPRCRCEVILVKRLWTDNDNLADLLRNAGPRKQLPENIKRQWEQQFRAELAQVLGKRSHIGHQWLMGLCASLVIAIVLANSVRTSLATTSPDILISHSNGQSLVLSPAGVAQDITVGQRLEPGSVLYTGANGFVALKYENYDVRLNQNTRVHFTAGQLVLESGELYASDYGLVTTAAILQIHTAHGAFRNTDTQFTVQATPDKTITTVRRGAVLVNNGREEVREESFPGSATRLTIDRESRIWREQVLPVGADWNWIFHSGSHFNIDGSTAYAFLKWSVGESGRQLRFDSPGAETLARTTRLHGNIDNFDPDQAVLPVLSSTDLVARQLEGNVLSIGLNRTF